MPRRLELKVDEKFQRVEWRLQRAGWAIWAAILLGASCGLLGSGWLSHCEVHSVDRETTIRYDRYLNYHQPTQIEVTSSKHVPTLTVGFNDALLDSAQILRIEPTPVKSIATNFGVTYVFDVDDQADSASVSFYLEFQDYGPIAGAVSVADGRPLQIRQYVYP